MTRVVLFLALVASSAFAQPVLPGFPTRAGGGASTGAWVTAYDVDFTALPVQSLATDGTYVVGGVTWTKGNSAAEAAAMVINDGLTITPTAGTDVTTNTGVSAPHIWVSMADIIPDFSVVGALRILIWLKSGNCAANYDALKVGLWTAAPNSNLMVASMGYVSGAACNPGIYYGMNGTATPFFTNVSNADVNADDVLVFDMPWGPNSMFATVSSGVYASDWPADSTLDAAARGAPVTTTGGVGSGFQNGGRSAWRLLVAGQRAGSGTALVLTVGRITVQYR